MIGSKIIDESVFVFVQGMQIVLFSDLWQLLFSLQKQMYFVF